MDMFVDSIDLVCVQGGSNPGGCRSTSVRLRGSFLTGPARGAFFLIWSFMYKSVEFLLRVP